MSGHYETTQGGNGQEGTQLASERPAEEISAAPEITNASRDKIGRFLKGVSGNRSGRPAVEGRVRQLAQRYSRKAVLTLVRLLDSTNPRVQVAAATALLDRALGKPPQAITGGALVNINMPAAGQPIRDVAEASRLYASILGNPSADLAGITFAAPEKSGDVLEASSIREEVPSHPRVEPLKTDVSDFEVIGEGQ